MGNDNRRYERSRTYNLVQTVTPATHMEALHRGRSEGKSAPSALDESFTFGYLPRDVCKQNCAQATLSAGKELTEGQW